MLLGIYCVSVYPFFPVYRTPLILTDSDQSRIQKAERKAREIESSLHDRLEVSFLVFYSFNSLYFLSFTHSLSPPISLSLTHTHTRTLSFFSLNVVEEMKEMKKTCELKK